MNHEIPQRAFYAIIPAGVRYCKDLEPNAKLFYGELTALANEYGYCWASNEYFAQLYDVDVRTIKRWLESLKIMGFIKVEVKKEGIKVTRKIWITPDVQKMFAKGQKCPDRGDKNVQEGTPSPYIYNNTQKDKDISGLPAGEISLFFYDQLQKINPKIKKPNFSKWTKEFDLLIKDGNSPEDIRRVIEFVISTDKKPGANSFSWAAVVLCPTKLRKHFATLWAQMGNIETNLGNDPNTDKNLATKIFNKLKNLQPRQVDISDSYLIFINGMQGEIKLIYGQKGFQEACEAQLNIRKLRIKDL